jgi:RHS repeat-associated protein
VARRIGADGEVLSYQYDTEERLVAVTNQRGQRYRLVRDALGRIVEEIDYWDQARLYRYSAAGFIQEIVDPLHRAISYRTDPLGRVIEKWVTDSPADERRLESSFVYDANGDFVAASNVHLRVERTFDAEGRLVREKQGNDFVISNTYDACGNRIERATECKQNDIVVQHVVRYGYDAAGEVSSIQIDDLPPALITRDAAGQVVSEQLTPGLRRELQYTATGSVSRQTVATVSHPITDIHYEYDAVGQLTRRHDAALGIDQFTYDPVGRVTSHLDPLGRLTRYFADPAGDRVRTRVRQGEYASAVSARTPVMFDGIPAEEAFAWSRDGEYNGAHYRFDRAGNLTYRKDGRGELRLSWDANQRLVTAALGERQTSYRYDAVGRRISKQTDDDPTMFWWDGDMLLAEQRLGTGTKSRLDFRHREYVGYGDSFIPFAFLDTTSDGTHTRLYCVDPNGAPIRVLDSHGRILWAARPGVFGRPEVAVGTTDDNPIRLQGQYEDVETGLFYNRHRYYDSHCGAFVSQDPLGLAGGSNPYEYGPNVTDWLDPCGLKKCNINKGTVQRLLKKKPKPGTMINPHMHHIVMEGAFSRWSKENRTLVTQARTILRKHGISLQGDANVVWARNAGHSVEYAKDVLDKLQAAEKLGGRSKKARRQAIIDALDAIGQGLG